jgi:hypothetical protein
MPDQPVRRTRSDRTPDDRALIDMAVALARRLQERAAEPRASPQ